MAWQPEARAGRPARLGITIRRAAVGTNVRRVRWKRWIREAFRRHPAAALPGWDVVVSVPQPPATWGYRDVEAALLALLAKAREECSR